MNFIELHHLLNADQPDVSAAPYATAEGNSIDIEVIGCNKNCEYEFYRNGTLNCKGHYLHDLPGSVAGDIDNYLTSQTLELHVVNNGSFDDKNKGDNHMENTYKDETNRLNKQLRKDALQLAEDRVKRDAASGNSKKAKAYLKTLAKSMKIPAKPKKIDTQKIHKSNY